MTNRGERRLASSRHRRLIANGLERLVDRAERGTELSAAVPPSYVAVRGARHALISLADQLRAPGPVDALGVALAEQLLVDLTSPAYTASDAADLVVAVDAALAGLGPTT